MYAPAAPVKTALGHEELRRRSAAIGQRHRTVLFLIDGRRPLSEVLSLSLQAGALTSHFEELVRLGLVELPAEAMATDLAEAAPDTPDALDSPVVTSVEFEVPAEQDAPWVGSFAEPVAALPESAPLQSAEPTPDDRRPLAPPPAPSSTQPPTSLPTPSPATSLMELPAAKRENQRAANDSAEQPALVLAELARRAEAGAQSPALWSSAEVPVASVRVAATPVTRSRAASASAHKPKPRAPTPKRLPARQAVVARPHSEHMPLDATDEHLLQQVRELLIDTLRIDAPLFGARMLIRVRAAKVPKDLIDLVWKFEKHLSRSPHSRNSLISLQRARELLGLGNTVVAGDTAPGRLER